MTSSIDEFDFSASVGATVAKEANKGGDFAREIEFLSLKADQASIAQGKHTAIVRLVTEYERKPWMGNVMTAHSLPWITVKQHYSNTRPKPSWAKDESRWPDKFGSVCRNDKVFTAKFGGVCLVCSQGAKATDRTWALGIEREQVIENGRVVGIRDKMRQVFDRDANGDAIVLGEKDGKKEYQMKDAPAWVVMNFGWKNFFAGLSGQAQYFQTALGRDYVITRSGEGNNDTTYSFVGLDPINITGQWATDLGVPEGTPYDMGYPLMDAPDGKGGTRSVPLMELLYPDMPDLRKIVAERTSEEFIGRWFDPNWAPEGETNATVGGPVTNNTSNGVQGGQQQGYTPPPGQPAQPTAPVTPEPAAAATGSAPSSDALAALRNRISGGAPAQ